MFHYENPGLYISTVYHYETAAPHPTKGMAVTPCEAVLLWDRVSDLDVSHCN